MPTTTLLLALIAAASLVVYILLIMGIWRWRSNRSSERPPTREKLLRGPGETLRKKIDFFDESLLRQLLACIFLPTLLILAGLIATDLVLEAERPLMLPIAAVLAFCALIYCAYQLQSILLLRRNHYLGYYGERIVSDHLAPLRMQGCCIFHDIPATPETPGASAFNIDHVVIAPSGLYAIETKTRRKGPVRPGFADNILTFDGQHLIYPWGEDTYGLGQSRRNANWLNAHLQHQLPEEKLPETQAILVFPGWNVKQTAPTPLIQATSPDRLVEDIAARPAILTPTQIDRIARQLEALCRDVEF